MKAILAVSVLSALFLAGCGKETEKGGPGAAADDRRASDNDRRDGVAGDADRRANPEDNYFTLEVPRTTTSIVPGERENVTIQVNRGSAFKEAVRVTFNEGSGVRVIPAESTIAPDVNETKVLVEVEAGATPGETSIEFTGEGGSGGKPVAGRLPIEIEKPKNARD